MGDVVVPEKMNGRAGQCRAAAQARMRQLVGEKRLRTWLIYMAGSAHAFARGWISIYQLLGVKAQADGSAPCPLTREHLYRDR